MSYDYSENILVQKSAGHLRSLKLKWGYPLNTHGGLFPI